VIFISYSWRNRLMAESVMACLNQFELPYWIDSEALDLRRDIHQQILDAISESSAVLCINTPEARSSSWVAFELQQARRLKREILAVRQVERMTRTCLLPPAGARRRTAVPATEA